VTGERITVRRGDLPCPGVRVGRVAAYEFDWRGARQRSVLLLDESIQMDQPAWLSGPVAGWWYVDLVEIAEAGDTIHVVDRYLDFLVGPPGLPYRVLDLDELGAAMTSGTLAPQQVAHVLSAAQAFADRYLQGKGHHGPEWPDFPPAALAPVRDIAIPNP
jgi:hypothetical protein